MMDKPIPENNNINNNTPDQYGLNVLIEGHSTPELRNEIYCQLIKQLTNNPKPQSINRGWNMMILCLYTFAPSAELENYLEVFIRNQIEERRNINLVALQSIMYSSKDNVQKRSPMLKDMQDILNGTKPLRRDFMETPPDIPSWADLLKSFHDTDEQTEEYFESSQQPLAGQVGPEPKNANNKPVSRLKRHHQSVASPAAPPSVAPPTFNFGTVAEEQEHEEKEKVEQKQANNGPPAFKLPDNGNVNKAPPINPIQAKQQVQVQAQVKQGGGNAVAELQAKLAAKGGPFGQGKTFQSKQEEKKEEQPKAKHVNQQPQAKNNVNINVNANANKSGNNGNPKIVISAPKNEYKWLCHIDPESGDVFYENIASGTTQWERPNEAVKPHWIAHLDPDSGELYFENIDTGETSWDKPDEFSDPDEKWQAKKDYKTNDYSYENLETGQQQRQVPACFQEKIPEQEWIRHFDPNSGEYYYENVRTGTTTWDAPNGVQFD